jgi:hypothetical protein
MNRPEYILQLLRFPRIRAIKNLSVSYETVKEVNLLRLRKSPETVIVHECSVETLDGSYEGLRAQRRDRHMLPDR